MVLDRPEHLRAGIVPMNDVLLHDVTQVVADFYIQTHSTNPLLKTETIDRAITTYFENHPDYDLLFSVTSVQTRVWDNKGNPINHDPSILLRTQDSLSIYEENSCFYNFNRKSLLSK